MDKLLQPLKPLLISLFLSLYCTQSFADFEEYFDYEGLSKPLLADEVTQQFLSESSGSINKHVALLEGYMEQLETQYPATSKEPVHWFIKGLNYHNLIDTLNANNGIVSGSAIKKVAHYRLKREQSYSKALSLDNPDNPALSAIIYSTMKHSLNEAQRIQALKMELSLGGSVDNESSYWFSHWNIISSLKDAGRIDEAEEALQNMKNELANSGMENSQFNQIVKKASEGLKSKPVKSKVASTTPNLKKSTVGTLEAVFGAHWLLITINLVLIITLVAGLTIKKARRKKAEE